MLCQKTIAQMLDTTWKEWNMTSQEQIEHLHAKIGQLMEENDRILTRADVLVECLLVAAVIIGLLAWALWA